MTPAYDHKHDFVQLTNGFNTTQSYFGPTIQCKTCYQVYELLANNNGEAVFRLITVENEK